MLKYHTEEELYLLSAEYQDMLKNTKRYRKEWTEGVKQQIIDWIKNLSELTGLELDIQKHEDIINLESISASLGRVRSGIEEVIEEHTRRPIIKFSGMLLYQQLFNGKIKVDLYMPFVEGIQQQTPPSQIGIYRPDEMEKELVTEHLAQFLKIVIEWENYDDDDQGNAPIGFGHNIIDKIPEK